MDNSSRHLSLTDRKLKPCFDYPCENNFQIADRLEKTKHKLEITYFSQNDLVLKILKFFPSHFHRRHLLMFSLPIEKFFIVIKYLFHWVKSVRIRSYSVRMRENTDQNNSEYGHILRSDQCFRYPPRGGWTFTTCNRRYHKLDWRRYYSFKETNINFSFFLS